ncbi:hypothetical protein ACFWXO_36865 [Kitasatospora sp. NPDC059088]|uniref:hypothetical protein n=1 Tax=Kitasatospora sp. NPDC059088 TaxID=3346722 RepID=UPI0036858534
MLTRLLRLVGRRPGPTVPPVRYLTLLETPPPAAAPEPKRDTEPRPLTPGELAGENCPLSYCGLPAASGTHQWRDRGPHQLLSCHSYRCPAGHGWIHETDGG